MEQGEARRRASQLGGTAVEAWQRLGSGGEPAGWNIGGWSGKEGTTWIVVSLDKKTVLDDRHTVVESPSEG